MSDMAAVCLRLRPTKPNRVPAWLGRAAQAFLLSTMDRIDPKLAKKLHDTPGMKPFTTSNLLGAPRKGPMLDLTPGQQLTLRFTALHPEVAAPLLHGCVAIWQEDGVTLHDQLFEVETISVTTAQNAWAGQATYTALHEAASTTRRLLELRFSAPTTFKRTGGLIMPLPLPELVFGSLMDRWNRFAPFTLPETLFTTICEQLVVQHFDGGTQTARVGKGRDGNTPGFVGRATYRLLVAPPEHRRALNALANYALFSGIGAKTTVGMGQVRRHDEVRA